MSLLNLIAQIGDEIILHPAGNDTSLYSHQPGDHGIVKGFREYSIGRTYNTYLPGIYANTSQALVEFADGSIQTACNLRDFILADKNTANARLDEYWAFLRQHRDNGGQLWYTQQYRLRELPSTLLWEDDTVWIKCISQDLARQARKHSSNQSLLESQFKIVAIDYLSAKDSGKLIVTLADSKIDDHLPPSIPGALPTLIRLPTCDDYTFRTTIDSLILIRHGNIWNHHHGEPVIFTPTDLDEEIRFNQRIGAYHEIRDPASGHYAHTWKHALSSLRKGRGHGVRLTTTALYSLTDPTFQDLIDSDEPLLHVVQFHDENFGHQVALHTLRTFFHQKL